MSIPAAPSGMAFGIWDSGPEEWVEVPASREGVEVRYEPMATEVVRGAEYTTLSAITEDRGYVRTWNVTTPFLPQAQAEELEEWLAMGLPITIGGEIIGDPVEVVPTQVEARPAAVISHWLVSFILLESQPEGA